MKYPLRRLAYVTLLAALVTPPTVWAQAKAAPPISGVIGKLQSFTGSSIDVMTSSGAVHIDVKEPLTTYKQIPSDLSHVTAASYVGVASAEQADGKQVAKQIFIFPSELSGAAEGSVLTDPQFRRAAVPRLWLITRTARKRSPYRPVSQSQKSHLKKSLWARGMSSTWRLRSSRMENL